MGKLLRLQCEQCGGELVKRENGKYNCLYCSAEYEYSDKEEIPSELLMRLNGADEYRRRRCFKDALEMYEGIISDYPDSTRAYWGAFLSDYGIEYVKSGDAYRPICHTLSRFSALDSQYLKDLLKRCDGGERAQYVLRAEQIEHIRSQSYEISRTQPPYDVFVCGGGSRTETELAEELTAALEKNGKRVFVPQKQGAGGGLNAEAYIYPAISSARIMFVAATDAEALADTQSIWQRFIADGDKRIQIIGSVDMRVAPRSLRDRFKTRDIIDSDDGKWLSAALAFADDKPDSEMEVSAADAEAANRRIAEAIAQVERYGARSYEAKSLTEAFVMALSCASGGNSFEAERAVSEQVGKFDPQELALIASLCVELCKMSEAVAAKNLAERNRVVADLNNIASRIRKYAPSLSLKEREVYSAITAPKLLVYLAKCFGVIKDYRRQCYVLDLVDCGRLYETNVINDLIGMMFANGRSEDVRLVLREVPKLDGNYVLLSYLKNYNGEQKQSLLLDIADKLDCDDGIEDDLNYFLSSEPDLGLALAVTSVMTRRGLKLSATAMGGDGALSSIADGAAMRMVLENFGKSKIDGAAVDRLIMTAANGGTEVANEVLRYLRYDAGIADIGARNMQLLINRCGLAGIKARLFDFNIDKKLAEALLIDSLGEGGERRLDTVRILCEYVPLLDIARYERLLLGNDPLKKELMSFLAPKTGKFASYNPVIESYLAGRDDDDDKRAIFAMFGDFPFGERALGMYLAIYPDEYDQTYEHWLDVYLQNYPVHARDIFFEHCDRLIRGYERVLPDILGYVKRMSEESVVRFVCEFKGEQAVKDKLIGTLIGFVEKPHKLTVRCLGAECNLLQAYLLSLRGFAPSSSEVVTVLRKKGMKPDDKIVAYGKKTKFADFVDECDVASAVKTEIKKYLK